MKYRVTSPKYSSHDNSTIDVVWDHPEHGEIPFTASPDDVIDYSREIYYMALDGEFGEVAPYTGPSEVELAGEDVRHVRDGLLRELDLVLTNPLRWGELDDSQRSMIAEYRSGLLNVPQQVGFPLDVSWPEKPVFI